MPNPHDTSLTLSELFDRCTVLLNSGESPHASTGIYALDRCNGDCLSLTLETEDSEAAAQMDDIKDELPTPAKGQTPAGQVRALLERVEDLEGKIDGAVGSLDSLVDAAPSCSATALISQVKQIQRGLK